jgi:hypothetical protein
MHVYAVSTPSRSGWRWRIMNYAGEVIEESKVSYSSVAAAVAEGGRRLTALNLTDNSIRPSPFRVRRGRPAEGAAS